MATLVNTLNRHTRIVTTCARPKHWWNEEVRSKRRQLDRVSRWSAAGRASQAAVGQEGAQEGHPQGGERVLGVLPEPGQRRGRMGHYTLVSPRRAAAVPKITHQRRVATEN